MLCSRICVHFLPSLLNLLAPQTWHLSEEVARALHEAAAAVVVVVVEADEADGVEEVVQAEVVLAQVVIAGVEEAAEEEAVVEEVVVQAEHEAEVEDAAAPGLGEMNSGQAESRMSKTSLPTTTT